MMEEVLEKISIEKYPAYKDSEVEWLGEIPEHWKIESFKNILTERNEKNNPIRSTERLSLSIGKGVTLYSEKTTNLDRFKDDFAQYKLAYKGDLVLNSMNMIVGAVGISEYFGCVSPVYYVYHGDLNSYYTTKFYEYLFRCKTVQGVLYSLGRGLIAIDRGEGKYNTLRLKVSREDLRSLKLPYPNLSDQTHIVTFLDHKTALIDKAISIKEKQIELLKERRQILIHNAVTRGLDPNVKMKDSGVEWIGKIPEGWDVKRIKHVTKKIGSGVTPSGGGTTYLNLGIPLLRSQNILFGKLELENVAYISEKTHSSMSNSQVIKGDVLLNITGGSIGRCHYVETDFPMNVNQHVCIVRPLNIITSVFLNSLLASEIGQGQIWFFQQGGGREGLNFQAIKNFIIPLPPRSEQVAISEYLERTNQKFDSAISLKEKEIEKLKEYKATLINSAVTGKIKVS